MKKFLLTCFLTLGLTTSLTALAEKNSLHGFYLGAGAGYSWQNIDLDNTQTFQNSGANRFVVKDSKNISQDLGLGQLFLGYGFNRGILYLGTELGFNLYQEGESFKLFNQFNSIPNSFDATVKNYTGKVSPKYGFQLTFLPGLYITPTTLMYGRVGGALTRYDTDSNTSVNQTVSPEISDKPNSDTNWVPEIIIGAGIRQQIWKNLSARVDYSYSQSAKFSGATATINKPVGDKAIRESKADYKLQSNNLMFSVIYNLPDL